MDGDTLRDSEEDVTAELALCGQTDNHHCCSRTEVVDGLLVGSGAGGGDDSGVRSWTAGGITDVLHEIFRLSEVDPFLCTELETEITLLGTGI